ncbi:MAG: helix-turn-helix transcriptional regulator [Vulcanimicrobiaceae bacterium]
MLQVRSMTWLDTLEEFAAVSVSDNRMAAVAYVLGYVDAGRTQSQHLPASPFTRRSERLRRVIRRALGPSVYDAHYAAGGHASAYDVLTRIPGLGLGSGAPGESERFAQLSRREREVASFAAFGGTNREIAQRLGLSVRTVDTHVASVLRKLGIKRRYHIRIAAKIGSSGNVAGGLLACLAGVLSSGFHSPTAGGHESTKNPGDPKD